MTKREAIAWLIASAAFLSCGRGTQGPTPLPSPSPSASPSPVVSRGLSVLSVSGHEFRDEQDRTVYLLGAIGAGAGGDPTNGWPLVSRQVCDDIADAGLNLTLLRIGPFNDRMPQGAQFAWDSPSLLATANDAIAYCNQRGVFVIVELFDQWCSQHGCSPFGFYDLQGALPPAQEEWARRVVASLGGNNGVLWVDANEKFKLVSMEWSVGLMKIVRDEEDRRGYRHHPFGTNSHDPGTEYQVDFVTFHRNSAAILGPMNQPVLVTEHDEGQSAEETIRQALQARDYETSFNRFRGDLGDTEWKYVLGELGKIRKGE